MSAGSPEVLEAIPLLEARGVLTPEKAGLFARVARGELVSVRNELRLLLYLGVSLVAAGVGLLAKEGSLGPGAILGGLSAAAILCLVFVARRAGPFTWGVAQDAHLGSDYMLLLGVLFFGADLAYAESRFSVLGPSWPSHLLVVAVVALGLAIRYDSAPVFGLGLSTFAAWRGVSTSLGATASALVHDQGNLVRGNAVGCGVIFAILGPLLRGLDRKAHFGKVADHVGWLLILGSLVSGLASAGQTEDFALALILASGLLSFLAYKERRFSLFAMGVVGGYIGLSALFLEHAPGIFTFQWFTITPFAVLVLLFLASRRLKEPQ